MTKKWYFLRRMMLITGFACQAIALVAAAGELTYQNPIEGGPRWIRDPFIIRASERYFMTGTYKEPGKNGLAAWPGFKLWSSDDLLHWKDEGFLLRNKDIQWGNARLWAPEIRFHPQRRKYYLTYNVQWDKTGRQGSGLAVADEVRGPYTNLTPDEPLAQSNDASLFFDDDGRIYLLQSSITICEVDLDQVKVVRPKKRLLVPEENGAWDSRIIEGANMVKIDGTYYLFWSATGWGYTVGYATANQVWGPYVKHPKNPIYGAAKPEYESKLNEPADCPFDEVGHGSLFKGPDGQWWLSSHGYGYEPGPFRNPRLCIDPLNFDPATGQFSAKLTWTPQTIRRLSANEPIQPPSASATKPRLIILADRGNACWASYSPDWSSLRQHDMPAWLDGLKLGIYCHWGPQTAMHAAQDYDMSRLDAIDAWKGEEFSAKEWVDLFQSAGVQFIGIVSFHGTGLVNWGSQLTDWNSVKRGPKVDIVGELTKEARKRNMKVLTSFHSTSIWGPISPSMPKYLDPHKDNSEVLTDATGRRSEIAHEGWLARMSEVIDRYQPDMVWLDTHFGGTVPGELKGRFIEGRLIPGVDNTCHGIQERYQQRLISYYYNKGKAWGKEVELIYKSFDIPPGVGMRDIEDGNLRGLQYDPWMTDINIAKHQHYPNCWFYNPKNEIKSADLLVDLLVDITSKNGRMLLSLPPCVDGTFSPEILQSLQGMGRWLKINGEAIYDTIPWVFFGEGPTDVAHPGHHGHSQNRAQDITQYTAEDIRFTQKGNVLYATCLGWPGRILHIRTLGHKGKLYSGDIRSIRLLGTEETIAWEQTPDALVVTMPDTPPCDYAYCLKIQR